MLSSRWSSTFPASPRLTSTPPTTAWASWRERRPQPLKIPSCSFRFSLQSRVRVSLHVCRPGAPVNMETIERRQLDRRSAEAREERTYLVARRRIIALEKALALVVGSLAPGEYTVDPRNLAQYRQGIDVARALLGVKPPGD